jgi:hypothetical protein
MKQTNLGGKAVKREAKKPRTGCLPKTKRMQK